MSKNYIGFLVSTFLCICVLVNCQTSTNDTSSEDESNLKPEWSYCFDFTWFGPDFDNITRYNGTCADYLEESRADEDIPCAPPIVISYDGTAPDIDYLWKHHKASVLCRQSDNQVCVSYKYLYNNKVNNATYMCAKVQISGEGDTASGCFKEKRGSYEVEMCVCRSSPGLYKPCNSAAAVGPHHLLWLLCVAIAYASVKKVVS